MSTETDNQQNEKRDPLTDYQAERSVFAWCSCGNASLAEVRAGGVTEDCFTTPNFRDAFRELCRLDREGVELSGGNLFRELGRPILEALGNESGVLDAQAEEARLSSVTRKADLEKLVDLMRKRKMRDALDDYRQSLERGEGVEAARRALQELEDCAEDGNGTGAMTCAEMVKLAMAELHAAMKADGLTGPPTGFPTLDRLTGGLQHGQYYVVGARCGVGKTALALNIALAVAKSGGRVLFLTAEMTPAQLGERLISIVGQVDIREEFRTPGHKPGNGALRQAYKACLALKALHIDPLDVSGWSVEALADAIRLEHRRAPLGLMVVDYLQILDSEAPRANASATENVAAVSLTLRNLAKAIDVPMLVLAQLNRESAKSAPTLAELKQSGQIEQDADMVLLLDRKEKRLSPDVGDKEREALRGQATLHVAKNRHGVADETIPLHFIGEHYTFTEE